MGLLDAINEEDQQQAPDEQSQQGPEWAGLMKGAQAPAGTMTKYGVMSAPGVGAEPRAGMDVPRNVQEARHWSQSLDLQRIGQIARSLAGIPEEARTQIMARILGIPLKSKGQQAAEVMRDRIKAIQEQKQAELRLHWQKLINDKEYRQKWQLDQWRKERADSLRAIHQYRQDLSNAIDPKAKQDILKAIDTENKRLSQLDKFEDSLKRDQLKGGQGGAGSSQVGTDAPVFSGVGSGGQSLANKLLGSGEK